MTLVKTFNMLPDEFRDVLRYVCVISAKFHKDGEFYVLPIISLTENRLNIIALHEDIKQNAKLGQAVLIKLFRFGFEFIVKSEIVAIEKNNIMSLEIFEVRRIRNYRQFIRYDVNLMANVLIKKTNISFDISIKDISQEGASFISDYDGYKAYDEVFVNILFGSERNICIPARILRGAKPERTSSGLEFIDLDDNTGVKFNEELRLIEKENLLPLLQVRKFHKNTKTYDIKVVIYSGNCDVIYYLSGLLILMGFNRFEVCTNFRSYKNKIIREKPDVVIVEIDKINDDILCVLEYTNKKLKKLPIISLLPYNFQNKIDIYKEILCGIELLYKPMLQSELEDCFKKLNLLF